MKNEVSPELLASARFAVRAQNTTKFDGEITGLLLTARKKLIIAGITHEKACDESDPLIKQALMLYVKAEFGLENPDAERYRESFEMLKKDLSLSSDYLYSGGS